MAAAIMAAAIMAVVVKSRNAIINDDRTASGKDAANSLLIFPSFSSIISSNNV